MSIVHTRKLRLRKVKQHIRTAQCQYLQRISKKGKPRRKTNQGLYEAKIYVLPSMSKKGEQKEGWKERDARINENGS